MEPGLNWHAFEVSVSIAAGLITQLLMLCMLHIVQRCEKPATYVV